MDDDQNPGCSNHPLLFRYRQNEYLVLQDYWCSEKPESTSCSCLLFLSAQFVSSKHGEVTGHDRRIAHISLLRSGHVQRRAV